MSRPISEILSAISDDESEELSALDTLLEEIDMKNTGTPDTIGSTASMDDIDAVLGTLEIDAADAAEIEEIVEDEASALLDELEISESPDDTELRALEVDLTKAEVYEAATSEVDIGGEGEAKAEKPAKKARALKEPKVAAPKMERDLSALPAGAFAMQPGAIPEEEKTFLLSKRPSQKKIAEKFDNTIALLHAGRTPSVYVMKCFQHLHANKTVTSADMVAALKAAGYTDGTARSQAGQIMLLFALLGIATRAGQTLTLIEESIFAEKIAALV